tara:strand:- start:326 stop:976 length:651 start_codon:yes stop_codon:yes gene_type:complete
MADVAGDVVHRVTGLSRQQASERSTISFAKSRDAFATFIPDHGEAAYRDMHREFDRVARNDTYGVMNPAIPDLIEEMASHISVYIVSHTTEDALKTMLGRMRFAKDLIDNRTIGMDTFETSQGWLRKDRMENSVLAAVAERDGIDLSRAVLFEDSKTNITISLSHGLGAGYLTEPDDSGGNLKDILRHVIAEQKATADYRSHSLREKAHARKAFCM